MAAADDSDVPESGAVFTFGKSKFAENLPNKFWVKNDRVLEVACGDEHTALVAESGRVFMFGPNDWGQLGVGPQKIANRPTCIKSLKHEKSKLVACGRSHTVIAAESGNIYTFGANGEGQLGVEEVTGTALPTHVHTLDPSAWKMLAAGCDHSMALSESGKVYVWGSNGEGQLGMGKKAVIPVPTQLDLGQRITCIACGYYHSAVVTERGQLFTCGESDGGKLGLGEDPEDCNTPQLVRNIPGRVTAVSCGGSHTAALTESGEVYVCGNGSCGQLGLGVSELESVSPTQLSLPFRVSHVCCGENFTAIVSDTGQLYMFGDGRHGKLALGHESFSNRFTPNKVDRFANFRVNQVACGGCHMIVRATPMSQNGHVEPMEEEEEEVRRKSGVSNTWQDGRDLSLHGSFSARDRRRSEGPLSVSRTLPTLGNGRRLPALTTKMSLDDDNSMKRESAPRLQRLKKIEHMSVEEDSEEETRPTSSESALSKRELPPIRGMPVPAPRKVDRGQGDLKTAEAMEKKKEKNKNKKEKKENGTGNEFEEIEGIKNTNKDKASTARNKDDKKKTKKEKEKAERTYTAEEETTVTNHKAEEWTKRAVSAKGDENKMKSEENEKGKNRQEDRKWKKEGSVPKKKSRLCAVL